MPSRRRNNIFWHTHKFCRTFTFSVCDIFQSLFLSINIQMWDRKNKYISVCRMLECCSNLYSCINSDIYIMLHKYWYTINIRSFKSCVYTKITYISDTKHWKSKWEYYLTEQPKVLHLFAKMHLCKSKNDFRHWLFIKLSGNSTSSCLIRQIPSRSCHISWLCGFTFLLFYIFITVHSNYGTDTI